MGFPQAAPSALPENHVEDQKFNNALETLKRYIESTNAKLLHAERKASECKSKLEIAERHGWDSERRRQEAEKQREELETKRREELKAHSEFKAKLAPIVAQLRNFTGS